MSEDLSAALVDVRKAYRLLYGFHRRVFDMARVVDGLLDGFEFQSMSPGNKPVSGKWKPQKKNTDYWQALPFYSTDFIWAKLSATDQILPTDRIFGLGVFADTAWGDGEDEDYETAPEDFTSTPEASKSVMYVFEVRPAKPLAGITAEDAWEEISASGDKLKQLGSESGNFFYVYDVLDLLAVPTKAALTGAIVSFRSRAEALLGP